MNNVEFYEILNDQYHQTKMKQFIALQNPHFKFKICTTQFDGPIETGNRKSMWIVKLNSKPVISAIYDSRFLKF